MSKVTIIYKIKVEVDLDLNKIKDYLLSKGFVDDGPYGKYGRYYFKPDVIDSGVLFPMIDTIGDFNARMNELIADIARVEKRTVPELLEDLK